MEAIHRQLVKGLQDFMTANLKQRAVLGLSGGIDSSLTLKIAVDALGSAKVCGLIMPELGVSSQENIDHAKKLAEFFAIEHYYIPINSFLVDYNNLKWKPIDLANMNTKARVRMTILYNYANTREAIVLGTGNLTELMVGYATKHGDLACDLEVIGSLYKSEVFKLAECLGLPPEIISKAPTAELRGGQSDEEDLGGSYRDIDNILRKIAGGLDADAIVERGLPPNLVRKIIRMVEASGHKRKVPPVIPLDK